jgi:hypothetical protein
MYSACRAFFWSSASIAFVLTGCVSATQVLEFGRDTYTVSATAGSFRTAASAREGAFETGASKCRSLGKHFMLVDEATAPTRMGIDTTVDVTFRCLSDDDPAYLRPVAKQ